ncbi:hypothetical protein [Massilia sp. Dwa41.01b]|uniref:hypothetical protein n=1 Tax=Massilia sp. Dwa41.01b TaxID=2709302 RepID=UPI001E2D599D|nr:hypothetical protein [Massilia sp. Dwa41.01b]
MAEGTDAGWVERQLQDPPFKEAARLVLPAPDALAWLRAHEREFKPEARLLVLGDIPMPATRPQFRHPLTLRTLAKAQPPVEARVAIVSGRAQAWRRMFAALDGPMRVIVEPAPGLRTELIVWDMPDAPPPALRAPLWWAADPGGFTELAQAKSVGSIRYAEGARGRVWTSKDWPPADPAAARAARDLAQPAIPAPALHRAAAGVRAVGSIGVRARQRRLARHPDVGLDRPVHSREDPDPCKATLTSRGACGAPPCCAGLPCGCWAPCPG